MHYVELSLSMTCSVSFIIGACNIISVRLLCVSLCLSLSAKISAKPTTIHAKYFFRHDVGGTGRLPPLVSLTALLPFIIPAEGSGACKIALRHVNYVRAELSVT